MRTCSGTASPERAFECRTRDADRHLHCRRRHERAAAAGVRAYDGLSVSIRASTHHRLATR
jgi:hypothetical protein